jgi:hypothetical protein
MSSENDSHETHKQTDEAAASNADSQSRQGEARPRWRSLTPLVGILVVAGGVGVFLLFTNRSGTETEKAAPTRGLACPYLQQASQAFHGGDTGAFSDAIDRAARVAEDTLRKSNQAFGEPERIALELRLAPDQSAHRVEHLLQLGTQECSNMGSSE